MQLNKLFPLIFLLAIVAYSCNETEELQVNNIAKNNSKNEVYDLTNRSTDCDFPEGECGSCKWRIIADETDAVSRGGRWEVSFDEGVSNYGIAGIPPAPTCVTMSGQTGWISVVHDAGVWYDLDCIAKSNICGDHFVQGESWIDGCLAPGRFLIQLDCGNGITNIVMDDTLFDDEVCCIDTNDPTCFNRATKYGYFSINDDCSIESSPSWDCTDFEPSANSFCTVNSSGDTYLNWSKVLGATHYTLIIGSNNIPENDCDCRSTPNLIIENISDNSYQLSSSLKGRCFPWQVVANYGSFSCDEPSEVACFGEEGSACFIEF